MQKKKIVPKCKLIGNGCFTIVINFIAYISPVCSIQTIVKSQCTRHSKFRLSSHYNAEWWNHLTAKTINRNLNEINANEQKATYKFTFILGFRFEKMSKQIKTQTCTQLLLLCETAWRLKTCQMKCRTEWQRSDDVNIMSFISSFVESLSEFQKRTERN